VEAVHWLRGMRRRPKTTPNYLEWGVFNWVACLTNQVFGDKTPNVPIQAAFSGFYPRFSLINHVCPMDGKSSLLSVNQNAKTNHAHNFG